MDITLPSGGKLSITVAPFQDAMALQKAVLRELKGMSLPSGTKDTEMSVAGLFERPDVFSVVLDKLIGVAVSDEVEAALFKCFNRCTYNGARLTPELFDAPDMADAAREDYYTMCVKVIEANCKPFFKKTFSGLSTRRETPPAIQP